MIWWTFFLQIFSQLCFCLGEFIKIDRSPLVKSLSERVLAIVCLTQAWLIIFPLFRYKKCVPSKLGKSLMSTNYCMYIPTFCLNSIKCWFCSLGPIVQFAYWKQYKLARSCVEFNNGPLMCTINILRSWERKKLYRYWSDPKRFAKFG